MGGRKEQGARGHTVFKFLLVRQGGQVPPSCQLSLLLFLVLTLISMLLFPVLTLTPMLLLFLVLTLTPILLPPDPSVRQAPLREKAQAALHQRLVDLAERDGTTGRLEKRREQEIESKQLTAPASECG